MTRSGKPQVPQEKLSRHTKGGSARAYPPPAGGEEDDTALLQQKEKTPNTNTGTTREGGLQLKHPRLATLGERERGEQTGGAKKATPKVKPRNKS